MEKYAASVTTAGLLAIRAALLNQFRRPLRKQSARNVATEFFRSITADHYVVSADGRFGNPEISTLQMISEARGNDKFTIHLTNREARLDKFFASEKAKGKKYDVAFRDPKQLSLKVELGDDKLAD